MTLLKKMIRDGEERRSRMNIPRQIIECTRKVTAVYVNDDGSLWRCPVIAIALYDVVKEKEYGDDEDRVIEKGLIKYIPFSRIEGEGFDLVDDNNLLGYEIDGEQESWEEEIKCYFEEEKRKREVLELHRKRILELQEKCGKNVARDFDRKYGSCPAYTKAKEEFKRLMAQKENS
jgi:hypothetical protein